MTIDPYILAFSALTVIATIWMGFWSAKRSKTASDFFVAGRSVSVGWNASAISGEYLSAASFMGVAGMVMSSGYDALWYPVCYACGYLFLLLFIAGPLRRFGAYTIPDFAEGRFDSPLFRKIAVVFVLFIGFFYTMPQMKGAGTTLNYIFQDLDFRGTAFAFLAPHEKGEALKGLHYGVGVFLVGAVITLNVALGGMKGITLVQAFQYWLKMFAISVPIFVLMAVYGHYGNQLKENHANQNIVATFDSRHKFGGESLSSLLRQLNLSTTFPERQKFFQPEAFNYDNVKIDEAARGYIGVTGRDVIVSDELEEIRFFYKNPVALTGEQIGSEIEKELRKLNIAVVKFKESAAVFVPDKLEAEVAAYLKKFFGDSVSAVSTLRKPLHDKAPTDSTRLTPSDHASVSSVVTSTPSALTNASPLRNPLIPLELDQPISSPGLSLTPPRSGGQTAVYGRIIELTPAQAIGLTPPATLGLASTSNLGEPTETTVYLNVGITSARLPNQLGNRILERDLNRIVASYGDKGWQPTRKQLPDKAPSDGSWLSPFGPLTTKAAKPEITYEGPLLINSFGSGVQNSFERLIDKMSGGRLLAFDPAQIFTFLPTNHSAFELVLTSTMERQFTRKISEIRYSPHLTNLFISWPSEPRQIKPRDFSKEMYPVLRSNGVTVIDSGELVTAFLTKDAKITSVNPKPYALLYTYSLIIALVCGTAGLPHILVRFYTNPDGVAAKRTTMWVMILIGVFYLFPPVFGVMGRNLLPELYAATGAKGTDKVVLELPRILNDSGSAPASGAAVSAPADRTGTADEASTSTREGARAPRKVPWGSILSGITCAGAFAAFMSTFSGLLVSLTGALAHDVYGRIFQPKSTPDQRMRMFKVCAVLCGSGAILLGFFVEKFEINKMVGWAFAIAATSYFPLLFLSTWWRGITMKGAATGMLVGGTLSLVAIASTMFADQAAWARGLADFYAGHPLLRILAEQPAIWALPLAIGLMLAISKLTAKEVPPDIRMKMLVLHAPEKLGLKQEYIQEHQAH